VAIASSRRGSDDDPIYVDLVLWDAQARSPSSTWSRPGGDVRRRLEPRQWTDREGRSRTAIEVHGRGHRVRRQAARAPAPASRPRKCRRDAPRRPQSAGRLSGCQSSTAAGVRRGEAGRLDRPVAWMRATSIAVSCCRRATSMSVSAWTSAASKRTGPLQ